MTTCPTQCSGKGPSRQRAVLAGERTAIQASGEPLEADAQICGYCGCVYVSGPPVRILGHLDGMPGAGWKPAAHR